jgi:hypothetical protein
VQLLTIPHGSAHFRDPSCSGTRSEASLNTTPDSRMFCRGQKSHADAKLEKPVQNLSRK